MSDKSFLMNNLNKLISSKPASNEEIENKSKELEKELADEARKLTKSSKKKVESKSSLDNSASELDDQFTHDDRDEHVDADHQNSLEHEHVQMRIQNLNSPEYKDNVLDFISKHLHLGYSKYDILEQLVEMGMEYEYANELVNSFDIKNDLEESVFGTGTKKITKSENRTHVLNFSILIFFTLLVSVASNTNPAVVAAAFLPSIINLLFLTFYFSKIRSKNYYVSNIFYLVIIVAFAFLFNSIPQIANTMDIKAIVILNLIFTFIFALFEFENLFLFFNNIKTHTNLDKEQGTKSEIQKTLTSNINVLKGYLKELNQLIKKTYGLPLKDLKDVLIESKQLKILENIDYKNIAIKANHYANAIDLLEYQVRRLEDNEKLLIPSAIDKTPHLKRDKDGRYSILSVVMINNEDVDLKELYNNIYFIIDTIKGELYNLNI